MEFANNEYISNIPIASYELREAIESEEIDIIKIRGYVWKPHSEAENPFRQHLFFR